MIVFIIIAILVCLGSGTFALLNWQALDILWAQPIVFIAGCLSFIFIGALVVTLIEFIAGSKGE
nr:MAG TPA: hypothetical protein [Caudoviricetes sp.]